MRAEEAPMQSSGGDLDVTHLRGRVAALIRASVLATLTEAQKAKLREALPPEAKAFMAQAPEAEGWVPTPLLARFLAEAQALSPVRTARSRAQMQADVLLEGVPALQGAGPREVVARLPWFYSEVHQGGQISLSDVAEGKAVVHVLARYPYPDWYTEVLPMWLRRALERAGGKDVDVRHHPPAPPAEPWLHHYFLSWKP